MNLPSAAALANKVLIGGRALVALGSSRNTLDVDYLINDETQDDMFLHDGPANVDYINANGHKFFAEVWAAEQGRQIASAQGLLELKAYAFVQHCLNHNWKKADDAEFDLTFLVREFKLEGVKLVKKYLKPGELAEVQRVIDKVRQRAGQ